MVQRAMTLPEGIEKAQALGQALLAHKKLAVIARVALSGQEDQLASSNYDFANVRLAEPSLISFQVPAIAAGGDAASKREK